MLPRNSLTRVLLIVSVVILPVVSIHFSHNAAATQTAVGYCASGPDQSAVYVTEIFNTGFTLDTAHDSSPIQNEYNEYLKGRFDFKSNASYAVTCPFFNNMSQAQSSRRDYEMQMRQGNNRIVEVEWDYKPESGLINQRPRPGVPSAAGRITPQPDHTFCISDSYQNTVYFTGPVASGQSVVMSSWINGFTQFLKGKYSFQGRVYCNMGTAETARRLVSAHLDGSRTGGRRVVDTEWKYDASQATTSTSRPADQEDDRLPAQRPAAQPPNLQARDYALKEDPRARSYCVSDRLMAAAFDCDCLRRQISTYRLGHVSDTLSASPTPLEELFKGQKFDCTSCIQPEWKFKSGVRSFARSPGSPVAMADCTIEKFRALLEAKPYPSQARELLNEAIGTCR